MYADDTTLSINSKNIFEIKATLNEDLNSVNMWCTNNNMVKKTYKNHMHAYRYKTEKNNDGKRI